MVATLPAHGNRLAAISALATADGTNGPGIAPQPNSASTTAEDAETLAADRLRPDAPWQALFGRGLAGGGFSTRF